MTVAKGNLRTGETVTITHVRDDGVVEIKGSEVKVVNKFDFDEVWFCGCVLPEQVCPNCDEYSRHWSDYPNHYKMVGE